MSTVMKKGVNIHFKVVTNQVLIVVDSIFELGTAIEII